VSLALGTSGGRDHRRNPLHHSVLEDAMHPYPRRRPRQPLCTVTLTDVLDSGPLGWGFDPFNLPPGVEPSDDEILHARRAAYPVSQVRRSSVEAVS
jgi:hypothetical protein